MTHFHFVGSYSWLRFVSLRRRATGFRLKKGVQVDADHLAKVSFSVQHNQHTKTQLQKDSTTL
jgi:hypothetical protein